MFPRRGKWEDDPNRPHKSSKDDAPETAQPEPARSAAPSTPPASAGKRDDMTDRIDSFEVEQPRRSLGDLIVSAQTLANIEALLAKVRHHHTLYEVWNLRKIDPYGGRTAINLYGPPGTGKTFCAEAIADALGKPFIRVNYAEIESKYVGETPKNIKAAFAKAAQADAVLIFDEADSILGRRLTNVTQSADHGVNVSRSVMLMELDRFEGVTVFTTNLASNYDAAFVRRILGHIEMPLPDREARMRLWQMHLPAQMPVSPNLENYFGVLADASEGLAGGEILNAVIHGAMKAVQRSGEDRRVTQEDLLGGVQHVKKAKEDVANPAGKTRVTSQPIPLEEAPEDVQKIARGIRARNGLDAGE